MIRESYNTSRLPMLQHMSVPPNDFSTKEVGKNVKIATVRSVILCSWIPLIQSLDKTYPDDIRIKHSEQIDKKSTPPKKIQQMQIK